MLSALSFSPSRRIMRPVAYYLLVGFNLMKPIKYICRKHRPDLNNVFLWKHVFIDMLFYCLYTE